MGVYIPIQMIKIILWRLTMTKKWLVTIHQINYIEIEHDSEEIARETAADMEWGSLGDGKYEMYMESEELDDS